MEKISFFMQKMMYLVLFHVALYKFELWMQQRPLRFFEVRNSSVRGYVGIKKYVGQDVRWKVRPFLVCGPRMKLYCCYNGRSNTLFNGHKRYTCVFPALNVLLIYTFSAHVYRIVSRRIVKYKIVNHRQ